VPISTNPIIAANWDPKLTLSQNYKKLGLRAKLGNPAGGVEKRIEVCDGEEESEDESKNQEKPRKLGQNEGRIVRHEDGSVTIEYANPDEDVSGLLLRDLFYPWVRRHIRGSDVFEF
jgi:nucleolar protein 16